MHVRRTSWSSDATASTASPVSSITATSRSTPTARSAGSTATWGLGDLVDLHARYDHARTLEAAAKQATHAHIEQHFDQLVEDLRPRAEAAVAAVRDKADEMLEAVGEYQAVWGRSVSFTEPVRGIDGRNVPGIDTVGDLRRMLEPLDLPVPLPNPGRFA